ncbi:MAG: hypothetical protein AMXMBFR58_04660 [Phycisphaerae bacterium]
MARSISVGSAVVFASACVTAGVVISRVTAGPLDPPAGPVAPTHKTLSDVEPRIAISSTNTPGTATAVYRISQGGSYYLTANVLGATGKAGISVETPDPVTIDLNGFTLRGVSGATDGINNALGSRITVLNGTVSNWPGNGVEASTARGVTASFNGQRGISAGPRAWIEQCMVDSNGSGGAYGIVAGDSSTVSDCVVRSNGAGGISVADGSRVADCIVASNATVASSSSNYGIYTMYDCNIERCRVNANGTTSNASSGGILAGTGTAVRECSLYGNVNVGISAAGETFIVANHVNNVYLGSPAVGILVTGNYGRIEANHVDLCGVGIRAGSATNSNVVVRNSARGNTVNYDIFPSNDFGPFGAALTSTNPWANLQGP